VTRRAALKCFIRNESKVYYTRDDEEDLASLTTFAQMEAISTYNNFVVGGNTPLTRKQFK
jgi:hypothetical protein